MSSQSRSCAYGIIPIMNNKLIQMASKKAYIPSRGPGLEEGLWKHNRPSNRQVPTKLEKAILDGWSGANRVVCIEETGWDANAHDMECFASKKLLLIEVFFKGIWFPLEHFLPILRLL